LAFSISTLALKVATQLEETSMQNQRSETGSQGQQNPNCNLAVACLGRFVFEALSEEAVRYMCPGGVFFVRVLCVWLCAAAAGFRPSSSSHIREGLTAKRWRLLGERKRQTKVKIDFEIMARCT
jgi:hypothetical protein